MSAPVLDRRSWTASAVAGVLAVLLLAGGWWLTSQPGSPLRSWVERQHPPVVALAWDDPAGLPSQVRAGEQLQLRASVTTSEASDGAGAGAGAGAAAQAWSAELVTSDGRTLPIASGEVRPTAAAAAPVVVDLTVPSGVDEATVRVDLASGQQVTAHLEVSGG